MPGIIELHSKPEDAGHDEVCACCKLPRSSFHLPFDADPFRVVEVNGSKGVKLGKLTLCHWCWVALQVQIVSADSGIAENLLRVANSKLARIRDILEGKG